jgi:hypothetical protein
MTSVDKIYKGDIGTRLRTTLSADLSGYKTIVYKIRKPSGIVIEKPCTLEDETNGIVYSDTVDGDFDEAGTYLIQVEVEFINGNINKSKTQKFEVYDVYE